MAKKDDDELLSAALEDALEKKEAADAKKAESAARKASAAAAHKGGNAAAEGSEGGAGEKPEKLGVAGAFKKVSENVAGDMLGMGPGSGLKDASKPAAADETIELSVAEDRRRLALQGVGFLLLDLLALFFTLGFWGAANLTGNVAYLLLVVIALTFAWFFSRAMGKRFSRLASRTDVVDFGEKHVFIYLKADSKKAQAVSYKDLKNYKLIRQGKALRLLLAGDWVQHPSGFQLVDINRPFMADTLDGLEREIAQLMRKHRVSERK